VLRELNAMDDPEARAHLADFCGAPAWIEAMNAARPFALAAGAARRERGGRGARRSRGVARGVPPSPAHRGALGRTVAVRGCRGVVGARAVGYGRGRRDDRAALAQANREYEARFGHVFIVCASGKTAREMLEGLRARMSHDPETELRAAADEQKKITRLRLESVL
jgi:2-oxo-4-hydroxy-4-carboxy-5-ureidoimidazoline decarboxylase